MHVPANHVSMVAAVLIGMADIIAHAHQVTKAAIVGVM